jgi:hypothetical protein
MSAAMYFPPCSPNLKNAGEYLWDLREGGIAGAFCRGDLHFHRSEVVIARRDNIDLAEADEVHGRGLAVDRDADPY